MKKLPRKNKQWAKEAYESLQKALVLFSEEYSNPSEEEKFELFRYCVAFAAMNRDISDKGQIEEANAEIYSNLMYELDMLEPLETLNHTVLFLLFYLEAQVSFGFISEIKINDIMEIMMENYDLETAL